MLGSGAPFTTDQPIRKPRLTWLRDTARRHTVSHWRAACRPTPASEASSRCRRATRPWWPRTWCRPGSPAAAAASSARAWSLARAWPSARSASPTRETPTTCSAGPARTTQGVTHHRLPAPLAKCVSKRGQLHAQMSRRGLQALVTACTAQAQWIHSRTRGWRNVSRVLRTLRGWPTASRGGTQWT
jgi:hypothetical protein